MRELSSDFARNLDEEVRHVARTDVPAKVVSEREKLADLLQMGELQPEDVPTIVRDLKRAHHRFNPSGEQ